MNTIFTDLTQGKLPFRLALIIDSHRQSAQHLPWSPDSSRDITSLLITQGIPSLRSLAKEAKVEKPQVWRLQGDLLTEQQLAMLDSIAQLVLRVEPVSADCWNDPDRFIIHVRYSRTWEHVEKDLLIYDHGQVSKISAPALSTVVESGSLPVSTFDLSLSTAQKELKDALDLPHLRQQNTVPQSRSILADDFDDEDPDADLDI